MGKYKNTFIVKGSKTLIEVFIKELIELGYRDDEDWNNLESQVNLKVYGDNPHESCFAIYKDKHSETYEYQIDKIYKVPSQWSEALSAASELYVEERIIKDGDWVKWRDGNLYKLKHISRDRYNMLSWHSLVGFNECTDYYVNLIKDKSTPATSEEIKEWLIKWFEKEYDYNIGDYFVGLREVVHTDNLNNDKFLANNDFPKRVRFGSQFEYNILTDTLYNTGMADVSVVYERGQWINKKEHFPKLHNYSPVISDVSVQYGCKVVKKNAVKKLNQFIEDFNKGSDVKITSVGFDDYLVDTKNIEIIAQNI